MKIRDDHLYHGAALIQIAEHPQFTAINSLKVKTVKFENAYKINDNIAVYLKYSTKPKRGEYQFTFHKEHLAELDTIATAHLKTFMALVCVTGREVCCLSHEQLLALIALRRKALGSDENQYVILVTIPAGRSLRVFVNAPGVRGKMLGKPIVVSRNAYPNDLFD